MKANPRTTGAKNDRNTAGTSWPGTLPQFIWTRRVCPLCTSIEFQTAEINRLDPLMAAFRFYPVRCVNCFRRYYWFSKKKPGDNLSAAHP